MAPSFRIDPAEYQRLDLRAHSLLAGVPIHDVWAVDLAGGPPGRDVLDVLAVLDVKRLRQLTPMVKLLFSLRGWLGRIFGWDRARGRPPADTFASRLSPEDREASLVAPGTPDGARLTLFVSRRESISELRNGTVHAFSVIVLSEQPRGYRLYWAIHALPVGRITAWYLRLIDPFRRLYIYPTVLREVQRSWAGRAA